MFEFDGTSGQICEGILMAIACIGLSDLFVGLFRGVLSAIDMQVEES